MSELQQDWPDRAFFFETEWNFDAAVDTVWDELNDVQAFPEWWNDWRKAELQSGEKVEEGAVIDCELYGFIPVPLRFTLEVCSQERPEFIEYRSNGDLNGEGGWHIRRVDGQTRATYYWNVDVTSTVFRAMAKLPPTKWLLEQSHKHVMANGQARLQERLSEQ